MFGSWACVFGTSPSPTLAPFVPLFIQIIIFCSNILLIHLSFLQFIYNVLRDGLSLSSTKQFLFIVGSQEVADEL